MFFRLRDVLVVVKKETPRSKNKELLLLARFAALNIT